MPEAFSTVLLHFSGAYREASFCPKGAQVIDFTALGGTALYCDPDAESQIRRSLASAPLRAIHWIDGGDYHYVSRFWLERVSVPFDLVLFDHHPDDQPSAFGGSLLSCGSWVSGLQERLPLLRQIHWVSAYREEGLPLGGLPVYLSIDKDVLCPDDARTNWDQGTMRLRELEEMVRGIAARCEILGIDVCGEKSAAQGACGKDVEINRRTNEELQAFFVTLHANNQ